MLSQLTYISRKTLVSVAAWLLCMPQLLAHLSKQARNSFMLRRGFRVVPTHCLTGKQLVFVALWTFHAVAAHLSNLAGIKLIPTVVWRLRCLFTTHYLTSQKLVCCFVDFHVSITHLSNQAALENSNSRPSPPTRVSVRRRDPAQDTREGDGNGVLSLLRRVPKQLR